MTARQRLHALERIGGRRQVPDEPPATWSGVAAFWRSTLEIIGPDVDPALLARIDRIGARPGPAPGEGPASSALLVLSCPEACEITNAIVALLSCEGDRDLRADY